jgi:predicted nucleotidyltransferase
MNYYSSFNSVFKSLEEHNVEYVLIGGYAVVLYGLPRGTNDIDLFVNPTEKNIRLLQESLKSLFEDKSISEITLPELMKYAVIRYGTPDGFNIDIMVNLGERFSYKDLEFDKIDFEGIKIKIATPETLIRLKENTYRDKDKADIMFLKKLLNK